MQKITDRDIIEQHYNAYLSDESRLEGTGTAVLYFPESHDDVVAVVREVAERGETLVISGGRTGIVGGAVPVGSKNLLSLEKLKGTISIGYDNGEWFTRVPAGHTLAELTAYLQRGDYHYLSDTRLASPNRKLFYPVNPTEDTAHVGGGVATNASGSRSFHYGSTRKWVRRLTIVLSDGTVLNLKRGEIKEKNGFFLLRKDLKIPVRDISLPMTKSTVGYYLERDGDGLDLFIGSEGTLGIITEVDLALIQEPTHLLGQLLYFQEKKQCLGFMKMLLSHASMKPIAIEYFDNHSLVLLRNRRKEEGASSEIVALPDAVQYALYSEHIYENDQDLDILCNEYDRLLTQVGASSNDTWAGFDSKTLQAMALMRHTVPETINSIIGQRKVTLPGLRKLSSDMAVPLEHLEHMLSMYETTLQNASLEHVLFGHIGEGHIHVNVLPNSTDEIDQRETLFKTFAREVVAWGGSVAAEHGIGRLKKDFLALQYSPEMLETMQQVKKIIDKRGMLNPGVLFDEQ
ncbi:MAG: FAD-binding oxidoreductase [Candidatus Omnitrophica bacterium]|nr:FAD-binding oxidoreductase [Candidatus Omnitrophota bacterium]